MRGNSHANGRLAFQAVRAWTKWLKRRSQRSRLDWDRFNLELTKKDQAKLQPRLPSGILEGLVEDTGLPREGADNAAVLRAQKKASTRAQNENVAVVNARVQAMRNAAKLAGLPKDVLKAMGVGRQLRPGVVSSARARAALVVEAQGKYPEALRQAGILPEDIDVLSGIANTLVAADRVHEQSKVAAKQGTATRRAAQVRVEQAVGSVLAAAELALLDDPARLALYRAVVPATLKRKKPAKAT